ncbi:MAG: DivIVA domain-containing protein, partial [Oscillospiraceae bacterium]|nr:DivIVA domain-containing protein [Oscillospiraceae bacterium]
KFEKALVGGYEMSVVDDFLEQITNDYGTIYKENAILKSKLKILVEKVEEYRSTEDSMRMALVTAQKMSNEILAEAKQKGAEIVSAANEQAQRRSVELKQQLAVEEARLMAAEQKTSQFAGGILDLIAGERAFLEQLGELVIEPPTVTAAPVVSVAPMAQPSSSLDQMGSSVEAYLAEEVSRMTAEPQMAVPIQPVHQALAGTYTEDQGQDEAKEVDFFKMFDQDHVDAVFAESEARQNAINTAPAPVVQKPVVQNPVVSNPVVQKPDARAEEKIDIARSISAAMGDTEEFKVDTDAFWDDEGEPTTKRPKFDFDDLQFGTNFDEGK